MNFAPSTIWTADNLPIMRGMDSESVDLIYLDPPFNSKADYAAPIGSRAAGAAFKDTWTLQDVDVEWINLLEASEPRLYRVLMAAMTSSDKSYLVYMAIRLREMKRILKPTGSIYLHCDPTMSHYLKLVMDAVFGKQGFRNEVVWCYTSPGITRKWFPRKHDVILFYAHDDAMLNRDALRLPYKAEFTAARGMHGAYTGAASEERHLQGKVPEDWWADPHLTNISAWRKELTGYPTQKPLALLDRIIRASSNPGDLVLDPFCGCATTCVSAYALGRQWAGIDISEKAAELVIERITDYQGSLFKECVHRTDVPLRTDLGSLPRYNCKANREALYGRQAGNCGGCGDHFEMRHLETDHIIAVAKGGTDHLSNLQLLCGHCNRTKGDRGMEYLKAKLQLAA